MYYSQTTMNKKKTKVENPEIEQPKIEQPGYVKELLEKGAVVLTGRTPDELAEMVDNIPADVAYYAGGISQYYDTGLYRLQVNLKK